MDFNLDKVVIVVAFSIGFVGLALGVMMYNYNLVLEEKLVKNSDLCVKSMRYFAEKAGLDFNRYLYPYAYDKQEVDINKLVNDLKEGKDKRVVVE